VGQKISTAELRPGDLVFFNTLRRTISHVGIYLGNNRFVHASSTRSGVVEVSDLRDSYWAKSFNGARRLNPFGAVGEAGSE
jgi:cell wall-associated NlpC family hydrolase